MTVRPFEMSVWADTVYATAPRLPSPLLTALNRKSADPVMWSLFEGVSEPLEHQFVEWRKAFIHTHHLGPLEDLVELERVLTENDGDYPLSKQRSMDQASLSAAWWEVTSLVPGDSPLRATVARLGAAAATARALGATTRLRHSANAWPTSARPDQG